MAINRGKQFENKFKEDWQKTMPNSFLLRLPDQVSRYAGYSSNICDFIGYRQSKLFLIECKTTHENTLNFRRLTQFDNLLPYIDINGVYTGIIVWWIKYDIIAWVPIQSIIKMKKDNKKSINIKMIEEKVYNIMIIPSVKKRVFLDSDYSVLMKLGEE